MKPRYSLELGSFLPRSEALRQDTLNNKSTHIYESIYDNNTYGLSRSPIHSYKHDIGLWWLLKAMNTFSSPLSIINMLMHIIHTLTWVYFAFKLTLYKLIHKTVNNNRLNCDHYICVCNNTKNVVQGRCVHLEQQCWETLHLLLNANSKLYDYMQVMYINKPHLLEDARLIRDILVQSVLKMMLVSAGENISVTEYEIMRKDLNRVNENLLRYLEKGYNSTDDEDPFMLKNNKQKSKGDLKPISNIELFIPLISIMTSTLADQCASILCSRMTKSASIMMFDDMAKTWQCGECTSLYYSELLYHIHEGSNSISDNINPNWMRLTDLGSMLDDLVNIEDKVIIMPNSEIGQCLNGLCFMQSAAPRLLFEMVYWKSRVLIPMISVEGQEADLYSIDLLNDIQMHSRGCCNGNSTDLTKTYWEHFYVKVLQSISPGLLQYKLPSYNKGVLKLGGRISIPQLLLGIRPVVRSISQRIDDEYTVLVISSCIMCVNVGRFAKKQAVIPKLVHTQYGLLLNDKLISSLSIIIIIIGTLWIPITLCYYEDLRERLGTDPSSIAGLMAALSTLIVLIIINDDYNRRDIRSLITMKSYLQTISHTNVFKLGLDIAQLHQWLSADKMRAMELLAPTKTCYIRNIGSSRGTLRMAEGIGFCQLNLYDATLVEIANINGLGHKTYAMLQYDRLNNSWELRFAQIGGDSDVHIYDQQVEKCLCITTNMMIRKCIS